MNSSLVFSFLAMRFCIIFYIISDSFHLMRLKKLYKKYRDKRLHPKIYFLVTFVLFLLMIKDMIFICYNEIYGILSPLSCYISMIVLWFELIPNFDILDVMYPKSFSLDDEPVKVKYDEVAFAVFAVFLRRRKIIITDVGREFCFTYRPYLFYIIILVI